MNLNHKKQIESQVLDMSHEDTFTAEFYMHEVVDTETQSLLDAKMAANAEAERRTQLTGNVVEPNYSPENLIRLGAKQSTKREPWVIIRRLGARDYKSYQVIDEHKTTYPEQWAKFQEKEHEYFRDIRERRDNLQANENRHLQHQTGSNWQGEGVNYTPTPYSISFG